MADENKTYMYLDEAGLQAITKGILEHVNSRISERIVQTVDANSDAKHIPSAIAVYRAIAQAGHAKIVTYTGDINDIPLEDRDPSVMYYQRDNEEDTTWMLYIWDAENQQWVNVGDTEIDLSGYWKKSDTEALKADLGVDVLEETVASLGEAVTVAQSDITDIKERLDGVDQSITNINSSIDTINDNINVINETKLDKDDIGAIPIPTIRAILDNSYEETDPFKYEEVASVEDAIAALDGSVSEVAIRFADDVDIDSSDTITVPSGVTAEINIPADVTVSGVSKMFEVADGGTLVLNGNGKIESTTKKANGIVNVNPGGSLVLDGITIDCTTVGTENNWAYGVYAKAGSEVVMNSGVIKVAGASCISTNNTTGGADFTINGGELYAEGGYAIYMPAQGTVNINGGIVQGINARMGTINISGDAKIIPTTIDASTVEDIGANVAVSGSIGVGDTIAIIAGTYADTSGIDIEVNVSGNATVESEFKSAIGVYAVDTKAAANITINVENGANVTTTDASSDAIVVYDHDYIAAACTAAGKTYAPKADSVIEINVDGAQIYPAS